MANRQPNAFKRKLGEDDLDRISEVHDAIVDWVEDNCTGIINEVFNKKIEVYYAEREYRLKTNRDAIGGFVDLHVNALFEGAWNPVAICFEIKSRITQTGFLFRQLNWYKELYSGRPHPKFIVISPDKRHEKRIKEAEYTFYRYQDGTLPIPSSGLRLNKESFWQKCEEVNKELRDSQIYGPKVISSNPRDPRQ